MKRSPRVEGEVLRVDGSWGEGGGQILRASLSLAAVLGESVEVYNVRARRSPPGLRPQHLAAVKALAEVAEADVTGLEIGSREVRFVPGGLRSGSFSFDAGTAASTTLILQSLMPVMAFSEGGCSVELRGGTNNPLAPTVEFLQTVLFPTIRRQGFRGIVELLRRGFYPGGGGVLRAMVEPIASLQPLELTEFGGVARVFGLSYSSRLPAHIAERMARAAAERLRSGGYSNAEIVTEVLQPNDRKCAFNPGCGIIVFAELSSGSILSGDSLGELGKPAERVGVEAAEELLEQLRGGSPVDKHLGDQVVLYMALARGSSVINTTQLTLHATTCMHVAEKITGARFAVEGRLSGPATIRCEGFGLENRFLR